jgi:hypothetical protein
MKPKYDMLWKGMIEEVMADLLLFVDPEIGKQLDLGRGFEFLDKELLALYPQPEKSSHIRIVDKLVKIFMRDGQERFVLLHIEVQGKYDVQFNLTFMQRTDNIFQKVYTTGIFEQLAEIKRMEAVEEGKAESVRILLVNTEFSQKKIAELVKVPIAFVKKVKNKLSEK